MTLLPSWAERARWVEEFERGDRPRFVYGRNEYSASVCDGFSLTAIVDDMVDEDEAFGLPVIRSAEVPRDGMVVSAVVIGRPVTALRILQGLGLDCLDYFSLLRLTSKGILPIVYWQGFEADFAERPGSYAALMSRMADDRSQSEFERVLEFRRTFDLEFMAEFTDRQSEQYFEPFVPLASGDTFLDVGAFDGQTSLEYVRRNPAYGAVHLFEPSPRNRLILTDRLTDVRDCTVHDVVLGSTDRTVGFVEAGSASRISESEGIPIPMRRLDSMRDLRPSFIKVDIEGAEPAFLEGARETLADAEPCVALAAYHAGTHLRELSETLLELLPRHDFFFRHYTEGFAESDIFLVPS